LRRLARASGFVAEVAQVAPDTQTALALVSGQVGNHLTLASVAGNVTDPHVVFIPLDESVPAAGDVHLRSAWRRERRRSASSKLATRVPRCPQSCTSCPSSRTTGHHRSNKPERPSTGLADLSGDMRFEHAERGAAEFVGGDDITNILSHLSNANASAGSTLVSVAPRHHEPLPDCRLGTDFTRDITSSITALYCAARCYVHRAPNRCAREEHDPHFARQFGVIHLRQRNSIGCTVK
jgi:hypothetical protein